MVDVDKLSDVELRNKLTEFGFPVMPITGTTRKVMTKKLKILLENKNKNTADGRRSLGRYSSEEESDNDVVVTKKNRRVTMAAPVMQAPKQPLKKVTRIVETTVEEEVPKKRETRASTSFSATTRSSRIVKAARDEFDTGSDSESEITSRSAHDVSNDVDNKTGSPIKQYTTSAFNTSYNLPASVTGRGSPKKVLDNSYSRSFTSATSQPAAFSSPVSPDSASDRLNQIRSRLGFNTSAVDRPVYQSSVPATDIGEKTETPFLSNFTRRLSQLSSGVATSPKTDYEYKNIKEYDTNGASSNYPRTTQYGSFRSPVRSREYVTSAYDYGKSAAGQSNLVKNNLVPFTVLGVAFLFFLFVGFVYLGMRSDTGLEPSAENIPYCVSTDSSHIKGINCVYETDVADASNLLKAILPELNHRATRKTCGDAAPTQMTELDIIRYVKENFKFQNESRILNDLRNLEVLVLNNPLWKVSVVQVADNEQATEKDIVNNLGALGFDRVSRPIGLNVFNPPVPWRCSLFNTFFAAFRTVLVLGAIFVVVYLANITYKYYKQYKQRETREINAMIEKIIDCLQAVAEDNSENNYVVINHVRDTIVPIRDRKNKEKIWMEAVKFINENESRVRTEVQIVQGEETHVWRWLGSNNLSITGSTKNKSWQGQAFETQVGSVNSLPCSPTPCLKIRGMIEDGDRNTHVIREAVLSKCAQKCRILHCAVDTLMKCVYLKCADTSDAAVAYQNLHGWWYAGQLVTVKYLRLERYMQRFPDSPSSGSYLKATSPAVDWEN